VEGGNNVVEVSFTPIGSVSVKKPFKVLAPAACTIRVPDNPIESFFEFGPYTIFRRRNFINSFFLRSFTSADKPLSWVGVGKSAVHALFIEVKFASEGHGVSSVRVEGKLQGDPKAEAEPTRVRERPLKSWQSKGSY